MPSLSAAQPIIEIRVYDDQHCPSVEINFGPEHLNALYSSSGPLSTLPEGLYPAVIEFDPPTNLTVHLPFSPTQTSGADIKFAQTTSGLGDDDEGKSISKAFIKHPRLLRKDLYINYILSVGDGKWEPAPGWRPKGCYMLGSIDAYHIRTKQTLPPVLLNWLAISDAERGNHFKRDIVLKIVRPDTYSFTYPRGSLAKVVSKWNEWTEFIDGALAETYLLDAKVASGFTFKSKSGLRGVRFPTGFQPSGEWAVETTRNRQSQLYLVKRSDPLAQPVSAQSFKIEVKSYIAHMDSPDADQVDQNLGFSDADPIPMPISVRSQAYAFMKATDSLFSENPTNGGETPADYRLRSSVTIQPTCLGTRVASWSVSPVATNFGTESGLPAQGRVDYDPLAVPYPDNAGPGQLIVSREFVLVSYEISGMPNPLVLPPFNLIRPRTCPWIWHEVVARIDCASGQPTLSVVVHGSSFPSHRVWVNGHLVHTTPQGRFEHLWVCTDSDNSRIR